MVNPIVTKTDIKNIERIALVEAELDTLYKVSKVLGRSLNLHETLREVLKLLNDSGRLRTGMVSLLDQESGELMVTALHGESSPSFKNISYRPGEGIVGIIMSRAEPLVVECISDEPRF